MMDWMEIAGFSLGGAMLVIMAAGVAFAALIPTLDRWSKRFFVTLFSLLFLCTVTCFFALVFWYDPTKAAAERIVYFFQSLFLSSLMFMPTVFLLHSSKESIKSSALFRLVMALLGAYVIILIVASFTKIFYYVTPDNHFVRGPLWALWLAPLVIMMVLNLAGTIGRRKKLSKLYFVGLLVYLFPMTLTVLVHMFIEIDVFVVFGMALFALMMYGLILSDNVEQYMRQQQEIAHQRASIMVLQMRPHFIYNSMLGIYYLCDQDPEKAKEVTLNFTAYLRKNFAAIASEDTVSFVDELEHTRAYLAVEQAQFEDSLSVDFDTPITMFRIPPLTLQPIVENAVVHGLRGSNAPIHISVVTRRTDTSNEIIVEDNGPGFAATDNNEPHIALNNIRQRLEMMCRGTLTISLREGGGTRVKVTIPLDKTEE